MDNDDSAVAEPQPAAAQTPCTPAYQWTKDFRIVRTCR